MKLSEYQLEAHKMVASDRERDEAFIAYDAMRHVDWEMPGEMKKLMWVRTVVNTDPHDAIEAGVRVMSSLAPRVRYTPLRGDVSTKTWAGSIERNLLWQLKSANRRRSDKVEADVVRSALMYSAIAMQVIDLDNQIKTITDNGGDATLAKHTRRYSRFVVNTYNPRTIHTRSNNYGVSCVLLCQERRLQEVADEWGLVGKEVKALLEDPDTTVKYYDWWGIKDRCAWIENDQSEEGIEIINGPHGYSFLPWVAMMGGSTIESQEKDKYHPMLYSIWKSGQWETSNIIQSLLTSEVVAHSGSPRFKEEGPNPDAATVDYADPSRTAKVPAGNGLTPMPPPPIDSGLGEAGDRLSAAMSKSTVSQILMGAGLPSGTAYSTLNLATQSAMGALKPAKDLAERALAEMFTQMLLWVKETGKPLYAYGDSKADAGVNYAIEPDDFEEESLYIEVELIADVPTDRLQRVNAGTMAKSFGYSNEAALEDIGVQDPQAMMRQSMYEQYVEHKFGLMLEAEKQQLAQMFQQAQMEAQAAMQQAQQAPPEQMQGPSPEELQAMMQGTGPNMGGQGFNPAMGGIPPALAFPEGTRETASGMDRMGNPPPGGI